MNAITRTIALAMLLAIAAGCAPRASTMLVSTESRYKAGQLWSYKVRPGDTASVFHILRIDTHPKFGRIIHVAVQDVRMDGSAMKFDITAPHMAFTEAAIDESVRTLIREWITPPNTDEPYAAWLARFDSDPEQAVLALPVAKALDILGPRTVEIGSATK